MKKQIRKVLSMFFMFVMFVCTVAGCGDKEVTSLTVKEGTLEYVYMQNSDVSDAFDNIKVIVKYNDDTKEEVGKDKLTISEFNSSTVGTFKVTISYEGKSTEVSLKVTNNEDEVYDIMGVENPESMVLRDSNTSVKENKEVEFMDRDDIYVVGDDNEFVYFPKIKALDENNEMIVINSYKSVTKVYVKDELEDNYTLVADADVATYVEIDDRTSAYDFVDGVATGKYFKLEVRPYYLTEEQLLPENIGDYTSTIEFQVVDAYNVADEKQMVVMTNYSHDGDHQVVTDADSFLTTNGIVRPEHNIKGIVLHKNLVIEQDDLPAAYFETVDGEVYLKDYIDLYSHQSDTGSGFTLHGNYFTIDFSKMPKVNHPAGETSHTTAFRLTSPGGVDEGTPNTAKSYMENTAFVGNANRSADETKTTGIAGLILLKAEMHRVTVDNCLMRTFFMHLMTDNWKKTILNVNNVKSYDSYQNSIFAWGGTINISNSELKRAGGPLMILQHPHLDDSDYDDVIEHYAPEVYVDAYTAARLESFVTGNEPWFVTMGASKTVTFLNALAKTFEGKGKTYVKEVQDAEGNTINAMNLISVVMSSGYSIETVTQGSARAKGIVKFGVEFDANGDAVANTGSDIINKYPEGINGVKAGLTQIPLVQALVKQNVLNAMYEEISKDAGQKAALESQGVTSAETLGAFIESNRSTYDGIVALVEQKTAELAQGGATPEQIKQAIEAYFAEPANQQAGMLYTIVSTYDAQVASSENAQRAAELIMSNAPVFKSTENGIGFVYTSQSFDLEDENLDIGQLINSFALHDNGNRLYTGDYLGMYYLGMGITLGYYDTAAN